MEDKEEENQPQEQADQDVSAKIQAIIDCALEWKDCGEIAEEVPIALTIATRGNANGWAIVQAEADRLSEQRKAGIAGERAAAAVQTALEVWLVERMTDERWAEYHARRRQDLSKQMRQEEETEKWQTGEVEEEEGEAKNIKIEADGYHEAYNMFCQGISLEKKMRMMERTLYVMLHVYSGRRRQGLAAKLGVLNGTRKFRHPRYLH